jgi:protein arginine kinase
MKLLEFLKTPDAYTRRTGPLDKIVLTSRVRLARNLEAVSFPGHSKKAQRVKALESLLPAVSELDSMQGGAHEGMGKLTALEKQILVERHLISREHAARGVGSAVVLSKDEVISVMINEEDHLRMQVILPGLQVKEAWMKIDSFDSQLENVVPYAFSAKYGYLTACPTNLGTGIRVSAMLHLPVNKLGLAVRGLYGEGTEALGNVFQVSNQMTLGESEAEIVEKLNKVVLQIVENEENARQKVLETNPKMLLNHIGRAYGILSHSHSISSKETKNLLSLLRLGVDLELFPSEDRALVDELFIVTEPAHIQRRSEGKKTAEERDVLRADLLRERLVEVPRPSDNKLDGTESESDEA